MAKRSFTQILERQRKFVIQECRQTTDETGAELKTQHRKVVRSWSHRPGFRQQNTSGASDYTVKIIPTGRYAPIFGYVNLGTKPHVIRAKNKPFLAFQTGYSARTAPIAKFNQGTGQKFGAWKRKKEVHHPGTKARKFSETFFKELSPPFVDRIQAAVKRGLNKANR